MPSGIYNHKLSRPNYNHSVETIEKIRLRKKGKPFSGIRYNFKGKIMSEEQKRKISLSNRGK